MVKFYNLLPTIIRLKDAQASSGGGLDPILERITDRVLQDQADEHVALIEAMRQLYDCMQVDNPYRRLLFEMVGQEISEGWYESLEKFMLCEAVPWHKISATLQGWDKTMVYRLSGQYDIYELFKGTVYEVGDYSPVNDSSHPYNAARIAFTPVGVTPYDWSTDTVVCVPPYIPSEDEDEDDVPPVEIDYDAGEEDDFLPYEGLQVLFTGCQKIVSPTRSFKNRFGRGVAVEGFDLFIGEPLWTNSASELPSQGRVTRWRQNANNVWVMQQALTLPPVFYTIPPDPFPTVRMGTAVYAHDDYLIACWEAESFTVFKRGLDGDYSLLETINYGAETDLHRRASMATHSGGKVYAVSIYDGTNQEKLALHVENDTMDGFDLSTSGVDISGATAVTADGDYVAVGRGKTSFGGVAWMGRVDIYKVVTSGSTLELQYRRTIRQTDTDDIITQVNSDGDYGPQFGYDVHLNDQILAIASDWPYNDVPTDSEGTIRFAGGVDLYHQSYLDDRFNYFERLTRYYPSEISAPVAATVRIRAASTVFVGNDYIAVGSINDHWDGLLNNYREDPTGSVTIYAGVYEYDGYLQDQVLTPFGILGRQDADLTDTDEIMRFGSVLAGDVNNLLVGAPGDNFDEDGTNEIEDAGAVYAFCKNFIRVLDPDDDRYVVVCDDPVGDFAVIPIGGLDLAWSYNDNTSVLVMGDQYPPQSVFTPPIDFTGPYDLIGVRFRVWTPASATVHVNHSLAEEPEESRSVYIDSMETQEVTVLWYATELGTESWPSIDWDSFWVKFSTDGSAAYITAAELVVKKRLPQPGDTITEVFYTLQNPVYEYAFVNHSYTRWRDDHSDPAKRGVVVNVDYRSIVGAIGTQDNALPATYGDGYGWHSSMLFPKFNLPEGAIIKKAYFQASRGEYSFYPPQYIHTVSKISGSKVVPDSFTEAIGSGPNYPPPDPEDVHREADRTDAEVIWPWDDPRIDIHTGGHSVSPAGDWTNSPDITEIIEEIRSQPGYVAGQDNPIRLWFEDSGDTPLPADYNPYGNASFWYFRFGNGIGNRIYVEYEVPDPQECFEKDLGSFEYDTFWYPTDKDNNLTGDFGNHQYGRVPMAAGYVYDLLNASGPAGSVLPPGYRVNLNGYLNFRNINVPKRATIKEAYIVLGERAIYTNYQQLLVDFWGWKSNDPPLVTDQDQDSQYLVTGKDSQRNDRTNSKVEWVLANSDVDGHFSTAERTPDLKSIIQEIVNLDEWDNQAANNIRIGWEVHRTPYNNNSINPDTGDRDDDITIEWGGPSSGSSVTKPKLVICYDPNTGEEGDSCLHACECVCQTVAEQAGDQGLGSVCKSDNLLPLSMHNEISYTLTGNNINDSDPGHWKISHGLSGQVAENFETHASTFDTREYQNYGISISDRTRVLFNLSLASVGEFNGAYFCVEDLVPGDGVRFATRVGYVNLPTYVGNYTGRFHVAIYSDSRIGDQPPTDIKWDGDTELRSDNPNIEIIGQLVFTNVLELMDADIELIAGNVPDSGKLCVLVGWTNSSKDNELFQTISLYGASFCSVTSSGDGGSTGGTGTDDGEDTDDTGDDEDDTPVVTTCQGQCQVGIEYGTSFPIPPSQDTLAQLQYELEGCFTTSRCIQNVVSFTEAMQLLNDHFRNQRPIHVLPVYCIVVADLPEVAPQAGDDLNARIIPRFRDEAGTPVLDVLEIQADCTQGCQVSCETFCEVGCEDNCQGLGACENSCQLNCESNCQTDCEVVCQESCVLGCEDVCQGFCQTSCEEVCQIACEDLCQGSCEIAGCQSSCTSGCEDSCQFDCQIECEFECQSPAETACQTSCQEFCETCCQDACEGIGCQTTCELECQASCVSGCEEACETNCQSSCENGCQSQCEYNCQADCEGAGCEVTCEGGCQQGCETACEITCEGASCQAGCESSGCQSCCECSCQSDGCESDCTSGCTSGCQTSCESECQASGGCETGCEMSCEGSSEACTDCCEICCEEYTEYGGGCDSACQVNDQSCTTVCEAQACEVICQTPCESVCQSSCTTAFESCVSTVEGCGFIEGIA